MPVPVAPDPPGSDGLPGTGLYRVGVDMASGVYRTRGIDPAGAFYLGFVSSPGTLGGTTYFRTNPAWLIFDTEMNIVRGADFNSVDIGTVELMVLPTDFAFWTYCYLPWEYLGPAFQNVSVLLDTGQWHSLWAWPPEARFKRAPHAPGATKWLVQRVIRTNTHAVAEAPSVGAYSLPVRVRTGGKWQPLLFASYDRQLVPGVVDLMVEQAGGWTHLEQEVSLLGDTGTTEGFTSGSVGASSSRAYRSAFDSVAGTWTDYEEIERSQGWAQLAVDMSVITRLIAVHSRRFDVPSVYLDFLFTGTSYLRVTTTVPSDSPLAKKFRLYLADPSFVEVSRTGLSSDLPVGADYWGPATWIALSGLGEVAVDPLVELDVPALSDTLTLNQSMYRLQLPTEWWQSPASRILAFQIEVDSVHDDVPVATGSHYDPVIAFPIDHQGPNLSSGAAGVNVDAIWLVIDDNQGTLTRLGLDGTLGTYQVPPLTG